MNANAEKNENWGACPKCGEPVLIDPASGTAQPCANCASLASKGVGALGVWAIVLGVAAVAGLVYWCVRLLMG